MTNSLYPYLDVPDDWEPAFREDEVCCGFDIPIKPWGPEDIAFWTGSARYCPWKDVAVFFQGTEPSR